MRKSSTALGRSAGTEETIMIVKLIVAGFGVASILSLASVARADPAQEVSTAATHAGLAQKAGDLRGIHMHLQHVVNCLGGPNADGYDPAPGNPCDGQGNGAIPDTTDVAKKQALTSAMQQARAGVAEGDIGVARRTADELQKTLSSM
jgi:hypothetical protein